MSFAARKLTGVVLAGGCAALVACGLDTAGTMDVGIGDDASVTVDANGQDVAIIESGAHDGAMTDGPSTDATIDGTAADGSPDSAIPDSGIDAARDTGVDSAPDAPPCTTTNGCITVPSGWTLVAIETAQPAVACPQGFAGTAPTDVIEGPTAGANACGCQACSVATQPDCSTGPVKVFFDIGGGQCALAGMPAQSNNNPPGACDTDLYTGSLNNIELRYTAPPPVGGTCTSAGQLQKQNVTYAGHARVCMPDSAASAGCVGNQCTPQLTAPYSACIAMAGNQTCPSPYTSRHHVGADVSYTCGACGCSVTSKCTGTMTLYHANNCTGATLVLPVDDTCNATTNNTFASYKYAGLASNVMCTAGAAAAPQNLALVGEDTICCAP